MKTFSKVLIATIIFSFAGFLVLAQGSHPELPEDVTFPILELGNCGSKEACKEYCETPENVRSCLEYAEEHNILPQEEINKIRQMLDIIESGGGPGGCQNEQECNTYCDNPVNTEECIIFARDNNLLPQEELAEVERVLQAIRSGVSPPNCRGREACDEYCSQPENIEECINFSVAAGFMGEEEAEMVRKTGGKGPGDCKGKQECDAFCENPDNMEECMRFGLEYGLMPPGEEENIRRTLQAIEKGVMPPPCRSDEECKIYCSQPENVEQCINFSVAAGFMTEEDAAQTRKMAEMGIVGGPGGCDSERECKTFCDNPDNMEECIKFGVLMGDISQEEADKAINRMRVMKHSGPGGCQSEEECWKFCEKPENAEECIHFRVKLGEIPPEEAQRMFEEMKMQKEGFSPPEFRPEDMPEGMTEEMWREEMMRKEMEMREGMMMQEEMMHKDPFKQVEEIIERETERIREGAREMIEQVSPSPQKEPVEQPQQVVEPPAQEETCKSGANRSCGKEVGVCRIGLQICENGVWGKCFGGKEPSNEVCDGVDNDCDGKTDEGGVCTGAFLNGIKVFLADIAAVFMF